MKNGCFDEEFKGSAKDMCTEAIYKTKKENVSVGVSILGRQSKINGKHASLEKQIKGYQGGIQEAAQLCCEISTKDQGEQSI